jgi:hypothetical protein
LLEGKKKKKKMPLMILVCEKLHARRRRAELKLLFGILKSRASPVFDFQISGPKTVLAILTRGNSYQTSHPHG